MGDQNLDGPRPGLRGVEMTDDEILGLLAHEPQDVETVVLQAYQLGRLLGRNEHTRHTNPGRYEQMCEFVAGWTDRLIGELLTIWLALLGNDTVQ